MRSDHEPRLVQDSDARRFEKEIAAIVPELNRPYKLEGAALTPSLIQTTFEELLILYPVDARFREGYTESPEAVNIPNLFAKVFTDKASKRTLLKRLEDQGGDRALSTGFNSPLYQHAYGAEAAVPPEAVSGNGLKSHPAYGLSDLKPAYQDLWLSQLAYLLDHRTHFFTEALRLTDAEITETILRIRPSVQALYNRFDFQGPLPKLLVDDSSRPFSPQEAMRTSVILLFLTLCDFDVVVLNDTQGVSFENYIRPGLFSVFQQPVIPKAASKPPFNWLRAIGAILIAIAAYLLLKNLL